MNVVGARTQMTGRFAPDAAGWAKLFAAIDARDAAAFAAFLAPDASFRFGNAAPVEGREAIEAAVAGFFALLAGCSHRLTQTWTGADSAVCEGEVSYLTPRGARVTVPFVNVFGLSDGQIATYRIYIDNAPLFAALGKD